MSALATVAGGHAYTGNSTPPTTWFGLLAPSGFESGDPWVFGLLMYLAIAGLVLCWTAAIRMSRREVLSERQVWWMFAGWVFPLAIGPPLISKDIYAYAAQGIVQRAGIDGYRSSVAALAGLHGPGPSKVLAAVDPRWRSAHSPYGPVATALERLAADIGAGTPAGTLLVLRVVAVIAVLATARLALALAAPHGSRGLVLVGLNPLLLIHGVSGAHFEALMCALLLAGLLAARRGRWFPAIVLVCAAGLVKAPALIAVPAVIAWHVLHEPHGATRSPSRTAAVDSVLAVASVASLSLLVPDGWGWIRNLSTPAGGNPGSSLSGAAAAAAQLILPAPVGSAAAIIVRFAAIAAALIVVGYLAATLRARALSTGVGYALLAVALLGPVSYPWYALWGVVCILPTAHRQQCENLVVALCAVAALALTPGAPGAVAGTLSLASFAIAIAVLTARRWPLRRSEPRAVV